MILSFIDFSAILFYLAYTYAFLFRCASVQKEKRKKTYQQGILFVFALVYLYLFGFFY